ncbi:MAG: glycosyltransferase family 2 protein [Solirubrobacterales bacterium]|nr:glycosyltransferase family 2 protein [Solirubrobacterales bacterium]
MEVSVCVPVYRAHPAPNVATLEAGLAGALGERRGELVVALNGIAATEAGVPSGVRSVALDENRGVAPGWNAAARAAAGRILVFANDDVTLGVRSIERLARVLDEQSDAGVVGPIGARWNRRTWEHEAMVTAEDGIVACDAVSGFLFAARRETWEGAGGFDETYAPASWEEIDFNLAVQAMGLRSYAVSGVEAPHEWGISARQKPWKTVRWNGRRELLWSIHRRNRRHFLSKWSSTAAP